MAPELTIVIPSHRRADLLRTCLSSVTRHAPQGTEIIVVDDASATAEVTRAAQEFPTVRVLRLTKRRGFCVAANVGIEHARGRVVELLNDDAEVLPGWADAALACFADARIGAVAPLVLRTPINGRRQLTIDSAGDCYYLGGVARKRGHGEPPSGDYLRPCNVFGASASSAFYRRDAFLAVGGLPEAFGAYFEDVDLSFRLRRAGYEICCEPRSRVFHYVSSTHVKDARLLLEQQSLNEERVFWRNIPAKWLWRAVPKHVLVLAAKSWKRWEEGNLAPFMSGRLRILGEVSAIRRHRRELPQTSYRSSEWLVDEQWATIRRRDYAASRQA